MDREAQREKIRKLTDELIKTFNEVEGVDYLIQIESYDEDDDAFVMEDDCNNWQRSWC